MSSNRGNNKEQKEDNQGENYDCPTSVNLSLIPYWFLVALRIALTLVPQTGYIHPDEYFQSIEVLNGK